MTDQKNEKPETPPTATLTPEVAAKVGSLFAEMFAPFEALPDAFRKSHAELIAYTDRLILLAGGALTLTFSALALISGHLSNIHANAIHPRYIIVECWLLVVVIVMGLIQTRLMIRVQKFRETATAVALMGLKAKLHIISNFPGADHTKLPDAKDESSQSTIDATEPIVTICSWVAHVSLVAAFVSLSMFIQCNIGLILTTVQK